MNCDPRLACLYFALIAVILILILMQVWRVGYYKNNSNSSTNVGNTGERFLGPKTGAKPNSRRRGSGAKHDNPMFNRRSEKFAGCNQARQSTSSNNALGLSSSDMGLLGQSGFTL